MKQSRWEIVDVKLLVSAKPTLFSCEVLHVVMLALPLLCLSHLAFYRIASFTPYDNTVKPITQILKKTLRMVETYLKTINWQI